MANLNKTVKDLKTQVTRRKKGAEKSHKTVSKQGKTITRLRNALARAMAKLEKKARLLDKSNDNYDSLLDSFREIQVALKDAESDELPSLSMSKSLGSKGMTYDIVIAEFGMRLASRFVTNTAAQSIVEDVVEFGLGDMEDPAAAAAEVRIPDEKRFSEWRHMMKDIVHELALRVVKRSKRFHLLHDATTKIQGHMFAVCVRVEIEENGELIVIDIPLNVELVAKGTAVAEANAIIASLTSKYGLCVAVPVSR